MHFFKIIFLAYARLSAGWVTPIEHIDLGYTLLQTVHAVGELTMQFLAF